MTIMIPTWVEGALVPVEKLEAHQKGLRHAAISVFILAEGQVLLQQRAMGKYHTPGLWANTCCTHPHWGEDTNTAAHRRVTEELGITGVALQKVNTVEYRADVGGGLIEHEVVDIFIGHASLDLAMDLNPEEVLATKWVPIDDLAAEIDVQPQAYTPWLRIYMAEHAELIFGAL